MAALVALAAALVGVGFGLGYRVGSHRDHTLYFDGVDERFWPNGQPTEIVRTLDGKARTYTFP